MERTRFENASPSDQNLVLRLGFSCFDTASNLINRDREQEFHNTIQSLKEKHQEELQERVRVAVDAVSFERTRAVETFCDTIRQEREREASQFHRMTSQLYEQMNHLLDKHRDTTESGVTEIQNVIQALRGASSNSAIRGKIGETATEQELDKYLPSGSLWENTAGTGGKADFQATIPAIGKILIDIKNHEPNHGGVPARDRKKLLRDLDADTDAMGALLVATRANIQSAKHCQVIWSELGRPMVCCVLEGNWERLNDGIEVLRCICQIRPKQGGDREASGGEGEDAESSGVAREEMVRVLKETMKALLDEEAVLEEARQKILRGLTEVAIALRKMDPTWKPNLREWLMVNVQKMPDGHMMSNGQTTTVTKLQEREDIPKDGKGRNGKMNIQLKLETL
jgi:hypothetical protein